MNRWDFLIGNGDSNICDILGKCDRPIVPSHCYWLIKTQSSKEIIIKALGRLRLNASIIFVRRNSVSMLGCRPSNSSLSALGTVCCLLRTYTQVLSAVELDTQFLMDWHVHANGDTWLPSNCRDLKLESAKVLTHHPQYPYHEHGHVYTQKAPSSVTLQSANAFNAAAMTNTVEVISRHA
jgi:hypothetical protein